MANPQKFDPLYMLFGAAIVILLAVGGVFFGMLMSQDSAYKQSQNTSAEATENANIETNANLADEPTLSNQSVNDSQNGNANAELE